MYNLFAGTETLFLSVYEPTAMQTLLGGPDTQIGRRGGARGQIWYLVKTHHNGHTLHIDTEKLYLSVYETIAIQMFARVTVPQIGERVELGVGCGNT